MGSRGGRFDSICIRKGRFCCVLGNRPALMNQQKLLMDLVQSRSYGGVVWGIGSGRVGGEEVDFDLCPGISYFWGGYMVQKVVIQGLRSIAMLLLSLGSHCNKVRNSVGSSENKNRVVGFFFFFFFSYVGCSSGPRG